VHALRVRFAQPRGAGGAGNEQQVREFGLQYAGRTASLAHDGCASLSVDLQSQPVRQSIVADVLAQRPAESSTVGGTVRSAMIWDASAVRAFLLMAKAKGFARAFR
jgi:hypothetical protein